MEGDCDVLIAAASPDWESPGVVGAKLGKWEVCDVELISWGEIWWACGWDL